MAAIWLALRSHFIMDIETAEMDMKLPITSSFIYYDLKLYNRLRDGIYMMFSSIWLATLEFRIVLVPKNDVLRVKT